MIKDQAKAEYILYKSGAFTKIRDERDIAQIPSNEPHLIVSRNTLSKEIYEFFGEEHFKFFLMTIAKED